MSSTHQWFAPDTVWRRHGLADARRASRPTPKSRPASWPRRRLPRGWQRVDPRTRPPKGILSIWARVRRVLWSWWLWTTLSIWLISHDRWSSAAVTVVLALISHLTTPAAEPPRYGLDHEFAIDSPEFRCTAEGASGVPFVGGNALEILNNGDSFYPSMLAAIYRARSTITIEAYIYWAGDIGLTFANALAERARDGVRVTILLDAIGSADIGADILKTLKDGGCQVAWYNPIQWYTIGRFNNRTHRKSLIIDGEIAYTGGAGIADHWRGNARGPQEWRDIQIRIEGPAVVPLQAGFAHNWQKTTGELIGGASYYPEIDRRGSLALQTLLSSPETGSSSVRTMYYLSIVCARRSIYIANPYFVPDEVARDTLVDAKRRGVDVRVMVSGARNDTLLARLNSTRLFGSLLEAGIEILEYNRTMLHHKTMVVDGLWATIGTANFDNRSFAHNEESNVCVMDRDTAAGLERSFLEDAKVCDRVTLDSWKRRGLIERVAEVCAALVQEQV